MLPVELIRARTLAEAWEKTLLAVLFRGARKPTEYDTQSLAINATIAVDEPLEEPRIHPGDLYAYMSIKSGYVDEILHGTMDALVDQGKLAYTYHRRLRSYPTPRGTVDQIGGYVVPKLREAPHTRRAQAITWIPHADSKTSYPPCLQRVWLTVLDGRLIMETDWRSRDALKALGANMYAMTELQRTIAEELGVEVGQYIDKTSDMHIYETYIPEIERLLTVLARRRLRPPKK